jgi:hypothetical protein
MRTAKRPPFLVIYAGAGRTRKSVQSHMIEIKTKAKTRLRHSGLADSLRPRQDFHCPIPPIHTVRG